MKIEAIALKHLIRSKRQFILLLLSIVLSITLSVLLFVVIDKLKTDAGNSFDEIGANILVIPEASTKNLIYESLVVKNNKDIQYLSPEEYISINTIEKRANIATIAPKILHAANSEGVDFIMAGIYFQFEKEIKKWWKIDGEWPFNEYEVLMGNKIASATGKKPGDSLIIGGKKFIIKGILAREGTEEDDIVFANIMTVQKLFNLQNKISFLEVAAYCTTCPIEEIARQIGEKIPNAKVVIMADAAKARKDTIDKFASFSNIFSITILILGFVIMSLMMISNVNSRTREIGILRSIGYRKKHVADLILVEAAIAGLLGGITGYLIGMFGAAYAIKAILSATASIKWHLLPAIYAISVSTILGIISGIIPAVRAAALDPIDSIKRF